MAIAIRMPALSPTMEHGKLAKWHIKEGDHVAAGDVIAEIETDKATMEVEAVDEGVVAKLIVPEGAENVPVNAVIAVLAEDGESPDSIDIDALIAGQGKGEAESTKETATKDAAASTEAAASSPRVNEGAKAAAPAAASQTRETAASAASAASGGSLQATAAAAGTHAGGAGPAGGSGGERKRIFASPLARRLAKEHGIDLSLITGSGPRGRIIKRDVEEAIARGVAAKAASEAVAPAAVAGVLPAGMSDAEIFALYPEGTYDLLPVDSMRRTIAERLTLSKQTVPHFYLTVSCALDRLLQARARINDSAPKGEDGKPAWRLSVNDFIIKAWAMALRRVPDANVTWSGQGLLRHHHVDVSVAVAIEGGLITPVVRQADGKGLVAISQEMRDLAARARARKLMPEEYQGGSTSISNLGMFGVEQFAAVINPPQATLLAVGRGEPRPVVEGGEIVVRTMMTVTLSVDHRAVDGAVGAQALAAFKAFIEEPALMLAGV